MHAIVGMFELRLLSDRPSPAIALLDDGALARRVQVKLRSSEVSNNNRNATLLLSLGQVLFVLY